MDMFSVEKTDGWFLNPHPCTNRHRAIHTISPKHLYEKLRLEMRFQMVVYERLRWILVPSQ